MKKKFIQISAAALFLMFTVCLYGPLSLYLPNAEELWFDITLVLKIILPISLACFAAVVIVGVILPKGIYDIYIRLVMGIALGLYVQGNYINVSYGVMDGTAIQWENYRSYAYVNTAIWVVCLLIPWIIAIVFKKVKALRQNKELTANSVLMYMALFLFAVQIPALISQAMGYHPSTSGNLEITEEGLFELAPQDNTIVFLVDTLDEQYFQEFLEEYPEYTEELDGFVHYKNNLAACGRTILAIPCLFTGEPFTRQNLYSEYKKEVWSKKNVLSAMKDSGADVRVFSEDPYFDPVVAGYVDNMYSDSSNVPTSYQALAKKLYKMTMFKFAPHVAKKYFEMATIEFGETKASGHDAEVSLYKVNDAAFFRKYEEQGFTINEDYKSAFRFYHWHGAHAKYNLGPDGKTSKEATRQTQVAGIFHMIAEMMDEMKAKGIYESSNIIIVADHGLENVSEWASMLIKEAGKGENDPYVSTTAPSTTYDLTVKLAEIAGTTLDNQIYAMKLEDLTEGMDRERHYFYNTASNTQVLVRAYVTSGAAGDTEALTQIGEYSDADNNGVPYKMGEILYFSGDATANRYTTEGFGASTGFTTYLRGPHAAMEIPFERKPKSDKMTCTITQTSDGIGKRVIVSANGTQVFDGVVDEDIAANGLVFEIPKSVFNDTDILTLQFDVPEIDEAQMEISVHKRETVFKYVTIVFEDK